MNNEFLNLSKNYTVLSDEDLTEIEGGQSGSWQLGYTVGYFLGIGLGTVWNYKGFPTK